MKRKATHTGLEMSPQGQLLYKQIMDNMTFIKRQQWATTNYAVLIYAAIVYLHEKASKLDSALSVVAVLTAIFAIGLLVWFQCDLRSLRKRVERADNSYFNDAEKFALEIKEKDE